MVNDGGKGEDESEGEDEGGKGLEDTGGNGFEVQGRRGNGAEDFSKFDIKGVLFLEFYFSKIFFSTNK